MPTISVKLSDATRESLQHIAKLRGITPHAVMVDAIEGAVSQAQAHDSFISRALAAREQIALTGQLMEPQAFGEYLKAKVQGQARRRPQTVELATALKPRT